MQPGSRPSFREESTSRRCGPGFSALLLGLGDPVRDSSRHCLVRFLVHLSWSRLPCEPPHQCLGASAPDVQPFFRVQVVPARSLMVAALPQSRQPSQRILKAWTVWTQTSLARLGELSTSEDISPLSLLPTPSAPCCQTSCALPYLPRRFNIRLGLHARHSSASS